MSADTFSFRIGDFLCLAILDGTFQYPAALFFTNVPVEDYQPHLPGGHPAELLTVPYVCLYVDTGRARVLVDTGAAGFGPTTGHLHRRLDAAGVAPATIDTVILTHGHPDHIGGNLNGNGTLAFPNARFVMLEQEWAYWQSNPTLAELPAEDWLKDIIRIGTAKNLPPLRGHLDLLSRPADILPGVSAVSAPGHTAGHMAVAIESNGERLVHIADTVLHPFDFVHPETRAVVDHEPDVMIATRRRLLSEVAADRTLVMTSHCPFPGLGSVRSRGGAWEWTPYG